jgi:hypothetical protein
VHWKELRIPGAVAKSRKDAESGSCHRIYTYGVVHQCTHAVVPLGMASWSSVWRGRCPVPVRRSIAPSMFDYLAHLTALFHEISPS